MKGIDGKKLRRMLEVKNWYLLSDQLRVWRHKLPRVLFIKHSHLIDVVAVGIGLLVAVYLVAVLVFRPLSGVEAPMVRQRNLSVETVKNLTGWANERQKERERPIELKRVGIFNVPNN